MSAATVPAGLRARRRVRTSNRPRALTLVAAVVALAFIAPAVWILVGSFRPGNEIFESLSPLSWHVLFPNSVTLDNYTGLFGNGFGGALLNSVIVCGASVIGGLAMSALAAYPLAVLRFPGRSLIFAVIVVSFLVPFEAIAIPLSQLFSDWHLTDTYIGLILPGLGNGLAIFNLRQAFRGIPSSLREAAVIDGASEWRILTRIYLPLSGSALINCSLLIFLGQWTAYLWPLLVTSRSDMQVAPIALAKTFSEHSFDFGQNFAGAVLLSVVPAALIFLLQRFFTRSIANTGVK